MKTLHDTVLCARNTLTKAKVLVMLLVVIFSNAGNTGLAQTYTEDDDLLFALPPMLAKNQDRSPPDLTPDAPASLCEGLPVNDTQDRPMRPMTKPAPGVSYVDTVFGTTVKRISDSSKLTSGIVRTLYSTIQAWNADESLMILWHRGDGHYLYDGQSYQVLERLNVAPADIEQLFWSTSNSDLLFYPNKAVGTTVPTAQGNYRLKGNELMAYNVREREFKVIKDLNSECSGQGGITAGGDVQMLSYDDDVFGLRCGNKGLSYRQSTDTVTIQPSPAGSNAPQTFPSGERFFHDGKILNQQLSITSTLDLGKANEHSSLGRLSNGNDAYYAVAFDANQRNSCGDGIGSVVVHDATDASCRVLVGPATGYPYTLSGTHISALSQQRPGWAAVSSIGYGIEGDTSLEQELYLVNADPSSPEVCRVAHHRSTGRRGSIGYFAEPHPVLSPSGTRILFNSDWSDSGSVDVYVVELASYRSP